MKKRKWRKPNAKSVAQNISNDAMKNLLALKDKMTYLSGNTNNKLTLKTIAK